MEIDIGSTIFGAISIMLCVLPFVIMNRKRKKKEKIIFQSLSEFAFQKNCQIDQYEVFGQLAIGIDENRDFLFFYKQTNDHEEEHTLNLGDIQRCKVINTTRRVRKKEGNHYIIERLELSFIPLARNEVDIKWEFFNSDVSIRVSGELQLIEKWSKLINDHVERKQ